MKEKSADLIIEGKTYTFPLIEGTEGEKAINIQPLRFQSPYRIQDEGYASTSACLSTITFVDGEKGILHHRGYRIEDLAAKASFTEIVYLLFQGHLPNASQVQTLDIVLENEFFIDKNLEKIAEALPLEAPSFALCSTLVQSVALWEPSLSTSLKEGTSPYLDALGLSLLAKIAALVCLVYRKKYAVPKPQPRAGLTYAQQILYQFFGLKPDLDPHFKLKAKALDTFFILHADHEQNCSTATVRMIASSGGSLLNAIGGGLAALSGPLHGGANQAVLPMLEAIASQGDGGESFIQRVKNGEAKLMGFGHRVYKNHDPRAVILKQLVETLLDSVALTDPLLDVAKTLEHKALADPYFIERRLYPNLDFYSGILLKALNIPIDFFTLFFAMGRIAGWFAHYKEFVLAEKRPLYRPRQVYMGPSTRPFLSLQERSFAMHTP